MTEVFIGVGSNLDREASLVKGMRALRAAFGEIRVSSVWDNPAVGFDGDPFLNLVVAFDTDEPPMQVAATLDRIEHAFGRSRRGERKLEARALDLDLLLYGDEVIPEMRIPRDDVTRYGFVLAPLAELAPDHRHPVTGDTYRELWDRHDGDRSVLRKVDVEL